MKFITLGSLFGSLFAAIAFTILFPGPAVVAGTIPAFMWALSIFGAGTSFFMLVEALIKILD